MSKQESKGLVPALRFPEFQDKVNWELTSLKKLAFKQTERNNDGKLVRVLTNSAEHGVVDQRDYFDKDIATQGNLENYFIVDRGDFVYNPRISTFAPVGPISRNNVAKGVMSPLYTVFRFNNSNIDFYAYYFKTSVWHSYMRQIGSTGARHDRMAISNNDFFAMPLFDPSPKEQQKIVDCLASIDELITAETQKLAALKTHKKGLMQQLFPAEGETVSKLRFPEFEDTVEWEEKTIGQVAEYENGKAHEQDISEVGQYIVVNSKLISTDGEVKKFTNSGNCLANKNDILMVLSDVPNGRALAKCLIVDADNKYTVNQRICRLTPTKVQSKILFYSINRNQYFLNFDDGVKQTNLKNDDVLNCPIVLPKNPLEQQKIADFLTSIDDLVTAQTQKLEALKTHKKGLMQQLFPAMDEVDE
ncbi:MAG: restriction endonuclease subunit S [Methylophilus sp.]|uniref:restriction endonuclease subunit S n=1 Tax=Methylophilus sp. TaxID=29541 RepID=UPI00403623F8